MVGLQVIDGLQRLRRLPGIELNDHFFTGEVDDHETVLLHGAKKGLRVKDYLTGSFNPDFPGVVAAAPPRLAHPQFFVLVGVRGGGIWIIRLGGCLSFHETPPYVPQGEA